MGVFENFDLSFDGIFEIETFSLFFLM